MDFLYACKPCILIGEQCTDTVQRHYSAKQEIKQKERMQYGYGGANTQLPGGFSEKDNYHCLRCSFFLCRENNTKEIASKLQCLNQEMAETGYPSLVSGASYTW